MRFEVLMRFLLGLAIGACVWAIGNKAHAASDPQAYTSFSVTMCTSQTCGATVTTTTYAAGTGTAVRQGMCTSQPGYWFPGDTFAGWGSINGGAASGNTSCRYEHCVSGTPGCGVFLQYGSYGETVGCYSGGVFTQAGQGSCANPCVADAPGAKAQRFSTTSAGVIVRGGCVYQRSAYSACDVGAWDSASPPQPVYYVCWYYNTGQTSTSADTGVPSGISSSPNTCQSGYTMGTANGTATCLPSAGSQSTSSTTSTQKDGTGATTGSTTTTTTTNYNSTNNTSTTSTTVTTYNSSGQVTGTTTTTDTKPLDKSDMGDFCKAHPDLSICRPSSFSGSCSAFACDGDAVQCAISLEQHQRDCALFDTQTSLSTLGNQVSSGADPQAPQNPALEANRQTISLPASLSQDPFLAPGGLTDQQFTVTPWLTVTLPWSQLNYYLSLMGAIVVAFALVAAARIVIGAK